MSTSIVIADQEYIIEVGAGGYTYYRVASNQRFGKKVKAKDGTMLVWNGTSGTPDADVGLGSLTWGTGEDYPPTPPTPPSYATDMVLEFTLPSSQTVTLPLFEEDTYYLINPDPNVYNFTVDWGDSTPISTVLAWDDSNKAHTYAGAGTYTVTITGTLEGLSAYEAVSTSAWEDYLTEVVSLGDTGIKDLSDAFAGCYALTTFSSSGNTPYLLNMSYTFSGCTALTSCDVSYLSTALVESFENTFETCTVLPTLDVTTFDTGSADLMLDMFNNCLIVTALDVSSFDTSNVTNMRNMFSGCDGITTTIDISNFDMTNCFFVTDMFKSTSNVEYIVLPSGSAPVLDDTDGMFESCSSLIGVNIDAFDMSVVEDASSMFRYCGALTITVDDTQFWNNVSILTYSNCFQNATAITNYASIPAGWK